MEIFLLYIGKSALAAGAFYLVYLVLFQNQKQFTFNRIYLPVSLAVSFIIPLITFTTVNYVEPAPVESNPLPVLSESFEPVVMQQSESQFIWEWYHYLFAIYAAGTALFLFRLLLGHGKAWNIIRKSRVQELFNKLVNISKKDIHPFSFFSKIVLSENTLTHPNLKIIVEHEKIHVKEKHTLDILFTEILFLLQWFNPFAWLLKDAVKNNLEYKTDHEIAKTTDAQTYQLAMLALADKQGVAPFLTALNGSQLKSRIIMMKKKSRNKYAWLKQLVVLPLLAVLVMGLAEREVKTEFIQKEEQVDNIFDESQKIDFSKLKIVVDGKEVPTDSLELANLNLEGLFDIATSSKMLSKRNETISNIINAIKIDKEKVELKQFNGRYPEVSTLYIRTKNYVPGTSLEFEKQTDTPEFIKEKICNKKNSTEVNSQNEIQGKVTNEKGEPIEGASVVVEGRQFGVVTNSKGNYQIEIEPTDEVLIFGYLYHDKQKVKIDGKDKIDVQIRTDRNPPTSGSFLTSSFKMRNSRGELVKPVYLVNEEEVDIEEVDRQFIYSFQRLPDSTATKLYGQKGKNGVIILKLKNPEDLNTISGKITNEKGEPVEGATIVEYDEPGSAVNSTLSDKNGNFVYVIKRDKAVIKVVHFLYKTKELNINEKKVIDVQLEKKAEGSRLNTDKEDDIVIGNINWINNEKYSSNELTNALGIKKGDKYLRELIEAQIYGDISHLYTDNGYLFFNATITENQKNDNTIDLEITLIEGTRWKVGKIEVTGNKSVSTHEALNKILIGKGDVFSRSKLIQSVKALEDIVDKDIEMIDVEVNPESTNFDGEFKTVNLVFNIKNSNEKITTALDLRKFIVREINYEGRFPNANAERTLYVTIKIFNEEGKVNVLRTSYSGFKSKPDITLDEIVVAYKNKQNNNNPLNNSLSKEITRVFTNMPPIKLPDSYRKTIGIPIKFVLQE